MVRDYWIYQSGAARVPWALYVVKEYPKNHPTQATLDVTVYHEDIPSQMHSFTQTGLSFPYIGQYVTEIIGIMCEAVSSVENPSLEITSDDYMHIEKRINEIIYS